VQLVSRTSVVVGEILENVGLPLNLTQSLVVLVNLTS